MALTPPGSNIPAALIVATPVSQNPLQNASNTLLPDKISQPLGPNTKPAGFYLNDPTKTPIIPADNPQGKYFCTKFVSLGLMSRRDYLRFAKAHLKVIFTHGDFAYWYAQNAGKLVENARVKTLDWSQMAPLAIERTKEIYATEGMEAAVKNYMIFSQAMYQLLGKRDLDVEPFSNEFFNPSRRQKIKGTLRVLMMKPVWADFWKNLKMQWRFRNLKEASHGAHIR